MNSQHRAIRAVLTSMSPRRAVKYIQSFQLQPEEELFLIECDIHGLSYAQVADKHHATPEVIKRRRQRAYAKISDEINHNKEPQGG